MKTCKKDNCNNPVFSQGYCKFHQWCRTDKKKPKKIKHKITKEYSSEPRQIDLFMHIYEKNKRNWRSWLTNKPLPHIDEPFFIHSFAHILPKGLYKKFKVFEDNIFLLTKEEHHLFDFGTKQERDKYAERNNCSWDKLYKLRDELKQKYRELYA